MAVEALSNIENKVFSLPPEMFLSNSRFRRETPSMATASSLFRLVMD